MASTPGGSIVWILDRNVIRKSLETTDERNKIAFCSFHTTLQRFNVSTSTLVSPKKKGKWYQEKRIGMIERNQAQALHSISCWQLSVVVCNSYLRTVWTLCGRLSRSWVLGSEMKHKLFPGTTSFVLVGFDIAILVFFSWRTRSSRTPDRVYSV